MKESRGWSAFHSKADGSGAQSTMETANLKTAVYKGGSPAFLYILSMDHF